MIKKLLLITLITVLPLQAQLPTYLPGDGEPVLFDRLATPLIIASLATIHVLTAPLQVKEAFFQQLKPDTLTTTALTEYLLWSLTTLAHELGHATARKLLTGQNSAIHLGGTGRAPETAPLMTVGPINIDGMTPTEGNTHPTSTKAFTDFLATYCTAHSLTKPLTVQQMQTLLESPEFKSFTATPHGNTSRLLITLAGCTTGMLAHMLTVIIAAAALGQKVSAQTLFDHITINQCFNILIPGTQDSDAAILWREGLGIPEPIILAAIKAAVIMDIALEMVLATYDRQATPGAPAYSAAIIGAMNYFSRGYLRFHV